MIPILFHIGSFPVRSYGVMAAIGFLLGCWMVNWNRRIAGMTADQASTSLLTAMIAGIVGARLFYVIQFFDQYRDHLWRIVRIDQGGLVFYGGFLCAIGALILFCRRNKLDLVRVFDIYAPGVALAHACGRIGCFLNGCCYGGPTGMPWGVAFPEGSEAALRYPGAALHPVQLYEAGEQLILFGVYCYLVRHTRRGVTMSCYLIIYGVLRFLNELARGDNPRIFGLFTPAQLIGLGIVPVGILLLIYFIMRHEPEKTELRH